MLKIDLENRKSQMFIFKFSYEPKAPTLLINFNCHTLLPLMLRRSTHTNTGTHNTHHQLNFSCMQYKRMYIVVP